MGMRAMLGQSWSVLFVPRGSKSGPPIELGCVSAELVRASDFEVVATTEAGLTVASSSAPHFEVVVSGSLPPEAGLGELYYVRLRGEFGRKTYHAVETLVVEADVAAGVQNLLALVAMGGLG